jgi:hypothetical protein
MSSMEITNLTALDRAQLIERWRVLYGGEPPASISRPLLLQAIAYRLQEKMLGGLKPATRRFLAQYAVDGKPHAMPTANAKAGTRLLREWHGVTYEVAVLEDGAMFKGKRYKSLSEVARVITGVKWSGPLFFGLKKRAHG